MIEAPQDRFYLTNWEPDGDGETRRLMMRDGGESGEDVIMADFSRYPVPLGEELAGAALAAVNAHADANRLVSGSAFEDA